MMRHAFDIKFEAGSNNERLVGRCLKILHGYQCRYNINSIGVTFPDYSDETIGASIAFVSSDQSALKQLMAQDYFQYMQKLQKFAIHDIVLVPDNVPEVRFLWDRTQDKYSAAGRRRRTRRGMRKAKEGGYEYQPRQYENRVRQIEKHHKIPTTSSDQPDEVFYCRVQKHPVEDKVYDRFTSYGLGNKEKATGTVPSQIFTKK